MEFLRKVLRQVLMLCNFSQNGGLDPMSLNIKRKHLDYFSKALNAEALFESQYSSTRHELFPHEFLELLDLSLRSHEYFMDHEVPILLLGDRALGTKPSR